MKTLRASSMPLAMLCAGSVWPEDDEVLVDSANPAGRMGTAVHAMAREIGEHRNDLSRRSPKELAEIHCPGDGDPREMEIFAAVLMKFWHDYGANFPNPFFERHQQRPIRFPDSEIIGHADVVQGWNDERLWIVDYKTTRLKEIDYRAQMMTYLLIFSNPGGTREHRYVEVYLRDQTIFASPTYSVRDMELWEEEVIRVINWDGKTYAPGAHCTYCKRLYNCQAARAVIRATATDLACLDVNEAELPGPADLVRLYQCIGPVEGLCKKFREVAKAKAIQAGGVLPGVYGDLVVSEESQDVILPRPAWPILDRHFTEDEIGEMIEVHKTKMVDTIREKAGEGVRGAKKRAEEGLLAELEAANAIGKKTRQVMRFTKHKE